MAPQIFFRTKEQHAAVTERLQIMKDDFAECEYSAEALEGNGKKMMRPIAAGLVVLRYRRTPKSVFALPREDTVQIGEHEHLRCLNLPGRLRLCGSDATLQARIVQDGIDFVARRNLKANEELTFDSCATDWRDFSALPKEAQTNIDAADHLRRRLARISAPHAAIRDIVRDCVANSTDECADGDQSPLKGRSSEYAAAEVYWNQGGDYFSSPSFLSPFAQACVARRLLMCLRLWLPWTSRRLLDGVEGFSSRPRDAIDARLDATLDTSHRAGAAGSPKAVKAQLRQVDALQREFLVSRREGDLRRTCLHAVCAGAVLLKTSDADYAGVIEELCDNGADPNAKDVLGRAPVFCLARSPSSEALEPKALDLLGKLVESCVERGADINTVDRAGMNPLFAPCFSDDLRAVDALLKLGADPHRPFLFFDATMQASLSQVAATIRMAPRVIQALRDAEAQPSDDAAPSQPLPQMEIKCRACGTKQGRFRKCSRCKAAHYCSVECQKYDWQFHKRTCKPCVAAAMPASLSAGLASGRF